MLYFVILEMHREMLVSGLAMSVEVFSLILKEVKKARSSYRVSYNEENKTERIGSLFLQIVPIKPQICLRIFY